MLKQDIDDPSHVLAVRAHYVPAENAEDVIRRNMLEIRTGTYHRARCLVTESNAWHLR